MADRETYADTHGEAEAVVNCPNCRRDTRNFAFIKTLPEEGFEYEYVCSHCITDHVRAVRQEAEAADDPFLWDWDSELGNHIKAQRNILLDQWGWTVRADSPLSQACQDACLEFLRLVQATTAIYERPALVVFPQPPALEYMSLAEQLPA